MNDMEQLIKVNYDNEIPTVSGRELHEFLEVKTAYKDWFPRMCEYGFAENTDFVLVAQKRATNNPKNPYTEITDHALTIPMAKELCMLQRNEKGKAARQYFLRLEEMWNSPDQVIARALKLAERKIHMLTTEVTQQKQIIGELQPKAAYYDVILSNRGLVTITQIAKDYGMSGREMNEKLHELGIQYKQSEQWLLYAEYHDKGYTHSHTIPITHSDGTEYVKMQTKWTQKGRLFLYELLKRHNILPVIEQSKTA